MVKVNLARTSISIRLSESHYKVIIKSDVKVMLFTTLEMAYLTLVKHKLVQRKSPLIQLTFKFFFDVMSNCQMLSPSTIHFTSYFF